MNERLSVKLVGHLVSAWVRVYTMGLPPHLARDRLELIASEVWEQTHDAEQGALVAWSVLSRCLLGVPGDLSWRASKVRERAPVVDAGALSLGRYAMTSDNVRPAFLSTVTGLAWAAVLVLIIVPTSHSLAYAGALLGMVALAGWLIEARESGAGGEDDAAPGPSIWPVVLAVGVAALGAGLVFADERLGLIVALPWALLSTRAWLAALRPDDRARVSSAPQIAPRELDARARNGYAIALERVESRRISRRGVVRAGVGLGLVSTMLAALGSMVDYLWARDVEAFGGVVDAGPAERFPAGTKTKIPEGRFWLVSLTEEQGGPGYLALWQKCPHLGCVVPWEPNFPWVEPDTGETTKGWFRCPCHQSTYNHAGVRVYGPAPRSMDRMACSVNPGSGHIEVDTGRISKGTPDNATYAVTPQP